MFDMKIEYEDVHGRKIVPRKQVNLYNLLIAGLNGLVAWLFVQGFQASMGLMLLSEKIGVIMALTVISLIMVGGTVYSLFHALTSLFDAFYKPKGID